MSDDLWTFGSISFRRLVGVEDRQWFARPLARTIDEKFDTGERIVNRGCPTYQPLAFTAWCLSAASAAALEAAYGSQALLTSPTGKSAQALLTQADLLINDGVTYRVAVEFEVLL